MDNCVFLKDESGNLDVFMTFTLRWTDDFLDWDEMPNAHFYSNKTAQLSASSIWVSIPSGLTRIKMRDKHSAPQTENNLCRKLMLFKRAT